MFNISGIESYAQNKAYVRKSYKNNINFNLIGLFTRNAVIGYERNINEQNTIRLAFGVKYSTSADSYKSRSIGLFTTKNYNKVSKGVYIGLGYKYMLFRYIRVYLSAEAYYNHIYYNNIYYLFCVGTDSDSYVSLESMREETKGLKIIFGKKLRVLSGKNIGLEFDFFVSSGLALVTQEFKTHGKRQGTCSINAELQMFNPPKVSISEKWTPTLSMGILIGMPFVKK